MHPRVVTHLSIYRELFMVLDVTWLHATNHPLVHG